ncbi:MAG: hypothetical protein JWN93_3267 [Hyphomicrobiales bacterium]|nr:hypothetical protein [Hyphomicrobiales bacterium]
MAGPAVIGIVLRVDVRGWRGAPPLMPREPLKEEQGRDGARAFFYDLSPREADLSVEDACTRLASKLERMLVARSPFADLDLPVRLSLDVGVMVDPAAGSWSMTWPPEFLRVLGDAQAQLTATCYPATDGGEPLSEDDL